MRTIGANYLLSFASALLLSANGMCQNPVSYLNDAGSPVYATTVPVENGYINLSNGNLHLEFPLASPPQRGALKVNERLVYDSRIWMFSPFGTHGNYHWWPYNVYGTTTSSAGWQLIKGNEVGSVSYNTSWGPSYGCQQPYYGAPWEYDGDSWYTNNYSWTDSGGMTHPFNATETFEVTDCWDPAPPTYTSGYSTDGSGYSMSFDSNGYPVVTDSNGNEVYPTVADRYGNYLSDDSSGNLIDDTGRTPVITSVSGNTTYYDVLAPNGTINNQGTRVRYTVTTAPIAVSTGFNWFNGTNTIYEWNSPSALTPVQSIQLPDGSQYTFTYDDYGELSSITLPTGGTIFYGYSNDVDYSYTMNRWLSSRTVGTNPATTFQMQPQSSPCSGTTCIQYVRVTKPSGDQTAYTFTINNGAWNTATAVYTGPEYSGNPNAPYNTPALYVQNNNTYSNSCGTPPCTGANYLVKSLTTTELDSTTGGAPIYSQALTTYAGVGKLGSVKQWDYAASADWANAPTTTPASEVDYTYTGSDISRVVVLDSSGAQASRTDYGYVNAATATSGLPQHQTPINGGGPYLHTVTNWLNTGTSPTTTIQMDDTGQVSSIVDPDQNAPTAITYQCANSLPLQITNSLAQNTIYGVDCNSGAETSVKDSNDIANSRLGVTYGYDQSGRISSVTDPDGGSTQYTYPSSTEVDTTVAASPNPSMVTASIFDSYGKKIQTAINGVTTERSYDVNGRTSCVSSPHTSTSSSTDGNVCFTSYDGLDRPLVQQLADGNKLRWAYSQNTTVEYDEKNNATQRTSNALGQLTTVVENDASGPLTSHYGYDGLGDLQAISQVGNGTTDVVRPRTFTYDSLGRLVCSANPESTSATSPSCPSSATASIPTGTDSYSYDPNGNVLTKTDGRGVSVTYVYDSLNRMTSETAPAISGTPAVNNHWYYDTVSWAPSTNSIGRLVAVTNLGVSDRVFSYDSMGRVSKQATGTPSSPNNTGIIMTAQYDLAGNMTDLVYPDGRHIQQAFDALGRLCNLTAATGSSINCSTNAAYAYFSQPSYAPTGSLNSATLGNGLTETNSYNNRLQASEIAVANSAGTRYMDKVYCYGSSSCTTTPAPNNGNIVSVANVLNPNRSQGFGYDALNRLGSFANGNLSMSQSFSVDHFGNASASGTLSSPSCCNAKNQVPTYTYDDAGNVLTTPGPVGGSLYYNYDALDRLTSIGPSGSPTATYIYEGDGTRMRKNTGSGWTEYIYFDGTPMAEKSSTGSWSDYIYANGQRIARVDPTTNLVAYSQQFGNSAWQGYCGPTSNMTANTTAVTAPDGTNTATQFNVPTTIACDWSQPSWGVLTTIPSGLTAGQTYTVSVWLRGAVGGESAGFGLNDCAFGGVTLTSTWVRYTATYTSIPSSTASCSDGTRGFQVTSTVPGATYYVWGAQVEQASSASPYVPTGSTTQRIHYYSADHLGTTTLVTDAIGNLDNDSDYYPYGYENAFLSADSNHYKFTGYERDADSGETGNDYAMARYYADGSMRFMSPDPYNGSIDPANPQTFNRYAYALNNPLSYIDPLGLDICLPGGYDYWTGRFGDQGMYANPGDCMAFGGNWCVGSDLDCTLGSGPVFAGIADDGMYMYTMKVYSTEVTLDWNLGIQLPIGPQALDDSDSGSGGLPGVAFAASILSANLKRGGSCSEQLQAMLDFIDFQRPSGAGFGTDKGLANVFKQAGRARNDKSIQFANKQRELNKAVERYRKDCGEPPAYITEWATKPVPTPAPKPNTQNSSILPKTLAVAGGGVAGGLVACAAFVPGCAEVELVGAGLTLEFAR